jgi:hypothetical protein
LYEVRSSVVKMVASKKNGVQPVPQRRGGASKTGIGA